MVRILIDRQASVRGFHEHLGTTPPLLAAVLLAPVALDADTHYVWQSSPSPASPFTNWATAAHVIQDAVDASSNGDTVWVAGDVYSTGRQAVYGTMTNRVTVDRAITLLSLMGPEVTATRPHSFRQPPAGNEYSLSSLRLAHGQTCGNSSAGYRWTSIASCSRATRPYHQARSS